ncbi:FDXHR family putative zinc-binding protein [Crystallibacter degradans]|uniref:FDXHR family putative zinc-binding protein n=1 Tax=Crystallibacter degradans TaxID=2726743 RepID=UPI001475D4AD|nr:hypothetical protein [Arthrobacter sp. SF27]NMR29937.1 hypothetical protein [Arthrobacter sp. SF27]
MNPHHPKCGKTFPGGTQHGHCGECCETFSGLAAFESHRVGSHSENTRRCLNPAAEVATDGTKPFWQDDRGYWHFGERMTDEQKRARGWIK